jgi:hypothetical protein
MPAKRELTMRQIRQMLRLHHDGVSAREIGRALGVARSTIQDNLKRAAAAGLVWPLKAELTEEILEQRLFARAAVRSGFRRRSKPDWATPVRELKRPGVNLMVLWEEYRDRHPDGYGYSRFGDLFREFERRLSPVMRQHHAAAIGALNYKSIASILANKLDRDGSQPESAAVIEHPDVRGPRLLPLTETIHADPSPRGQHGSRRPRRSFGICTPSASRQKIRAVAGPV